MTHNGRMALIPFSPSALAEFSRNAVGQVIETAATVATVPVRLLGLVSQAELLATRITLAVENAESLIERVTRIAAEAEALVGAVALTAEQATRVVVEAESVATGAARVVGGAAAATDAAASVITDAAATTGAASAVVVRASTATTEAEELLHAYAATLRKAAPLAQRFVDELSPEEISAAIRMIDELPRLREHLSDDVMPLLGKLDQVGPDIHQLLEVTQDLHLAIAGLPGLKMLRRRGEEKIEEESSNGR